MCAKPVCPGPLRMWRNLAAGLLFMPAERDGSSMRALWPAACDVSPALFAAEPITTVTVDWYVRVRTFLLFVPLTS